MSKSRPDAGTIYLSDDPAVITKKIKRAVTDTDSEIRYDPEPKPGLSNLLGHPAPRSPTDRRARSVAEEFAGQGYGALKAAVAEAVVGLRRSRSPPAPASCWTTRPSWTGSWPGAPSGPGRWPVATVADAYAKVGFLPAGRRLSRRWQAH